MAFIRMQGTSWLLHLKHGCTLISAHSWDLSTDRFCYTFRELLGETSS
jgi:hypothetical protein